MRENGVPARAVEDGRILIETAQSVPGGTLGVVDWTEIMADLTRSLCVRRK